MNNKQAELVRKRNAELSKQIDELKEKIKLDSQLNSESHKRVEDLISDLEDIKSKWLNSIEKLEKKSYEYSILISELKEIKKIMTSMGFKIPWHKKILLHFQRYKKMNK